MVACDEILTAEIKGKNPCGHCCGEERIPAHTARRPAGSPVHAGRTGEVRAIERGAYWLPMVRQRCIAATFPRPAGYCSGKNSKCDAVMGVLAEILNSGRNWLQVVLRPGMGEAGRSRRIMKIALSRC